MTGSIAPNLHEGSRSEYLAQYVFTSFGTSIPVPHQEDSGVDLYCTLTERVGQRAFPTAHYTVQVKSTMDPWVLEGSESVRWLIQHPLPLFLCVIDKPTATIRVYHVCPRFYVWASALSPDRLELIPSDVTDGRCTQWEGTDFRFNLSAPILRATIPELLNDDLHRQLKAVLKFWTDIELTNLDRVRAGVYTFTMPHGYETNTTKLTGWTTQGRTAVSGVSLDRLCDYLQEPLAWLTVQLQQSTGIEAAALCAMLSRYLERGQPVGGFTTSVHLEIGRRLGREEYVYAGTDALIKSVTGALNARRDDGPRPEIDWLP